MMRLLRVFSVCKNQQLLQSTLLYTCYNYVWLCRFLVEADGAPKGLPLKYVVRVEDVRFKSYVVRFLPFHHLLAYYLSVGNLKNVLALQLCPVLQCLVKIRVVFNPLCVILFQNASNHLCFRLKNKIDTTRYILCVGDQSQCQSVSSIVLFQEAGLQIQ